MVSSVTVSKTPRKEYLDIVRGIAMCCIILGHMGEAGINRIVFTFHLPVFYFITGYFSKEDGTLLHFIKKKAKSLLIPYYTVCLLSCLIAILKSVLGNQPWRPQLNYWFYASLYGAGESYTNPFVIRGIGAIWFLWASFWAQLMLRILIKQKWYIRILAVVSIFFVSDWSRKHCFWFPLSIQAGGCALLFMYLGWLFHQFQPAFQEQKKEIRAVTELILVNIWIWCIFNFKEFWLVHCAMTHGIVDVIGSIGGCIVLIHISKFIENHTKANNLFRQWACFFGRYSLIVLCIHKLELSFLNYNSIFQHIFGKELYKPCFLLSVFFIKILLISIITLIISKSNHLRPFFGISQAKKDMA